jgi:hypothetical protein
MAFHASSFRGLASSSRALGGNELCLPPVLDFFPVTSGGRLLVHCALPDTRAAAAQWRVSRMHARLDARPRCRGSQGLLPVSRDRAEKGCTRRFDRNSPSLLLFLLSFTGTGAILFMLGSMPKQFVVTVTLPFVARPGLKQRLPVILHLAW